MPIVLPPRLALPGLLVLAVLAVLGSCSRPAQPVRIVVVTLDTLRRDAFDRSMPLLRERARRGLVFERAYAATASTAPTHASLFTGLDPWRHRVTRNGMVLGEEHESLAERLRDAGFRTVAAVASFPLERRFGLVQGFEIYDDSFGDLRRAEARLSDALEDETHVDADRMTEKAIEALDAASGEKQLFWFHYFDAHSPYGDSAGEGIDLAGLVAAARARAPDLMQRVESARAGYAADVAHLDRALERLLARIERDAGRYETHVLVTSDHGECFGEGGALGHGWCLDRATLHVPLLLLSPRARPGSRDDPASSIDVLPTVLALARLERDARLPGRDLLRETGIEPRPVCGMRRTFAQAKDQVRTDGRVFPLPAQRFYYLRADKLYFGDASGVECETEPVDGELAERIEALFSGFESELARGADREDLAPATQRALEALGYTR